jgi:hypothetical protein
MGIFSGFVTCLTDKNDFSSQSASQDARMAERRVHAKQGDALSAISTSAQAR